MSLCQETQLSAVSFPQEATQLSQLATFKLDLSSHLLRLQELPHHLQLLSFQSWYDMPCNNKLELLMYTAYDIASPLQVAEVASDNLARLHLWYRRQFA